ncbi:hypothetical protein [uncultured Limosilactobacillus sp.]|uniref:hypothetical protein n=1 Tax=uncultured Limosilactobacillus sp. TaxID=2837629 RepID=UPI0025DF1CAE|nr:hypothetical protein [uncultured Limosilactobacillus sp.]
MAHWFSGHGATIIIAYIVFLALSYVICLITNVYQLTKNIEDLNRNRDGLKNQHEIDVKDKKALKQRISFQESVLNLIMNSLSEQQAKDINQKLMLMKEIKEIEETNENSEDN